MQINDIITIMAGDEPVSARIVKIKRGMFYCETNRWGTVRIFCDKVENGIVTWNDVLL